MQTRAFEPIGAQVTGLTLRVLDPEHVTALKDLLADHGVVVLPGQRLDDDSFLACLRQFGELMFTTGESPVTGSPTSTSSATSAAQSHRAARSTWTPAMCADRPHTRRCGGRDPHPRWGTLFTNQYRAYRHCRKYAEMLEGRTIRHVVTGLDLDDGEEAAAEHPVFRRHPRSGRTALYISTPKRCAGISGMDPRRLGERSSSS